MSNAGPGAIDGSTDAGENPLALVFYMSECGFAPEHTSLPQMARLSGLNRTDHTPGAEKDAYGHVRLSHEWVAWFNEELVRSQKSFVDGWLQTHFKDMPILLEVVPVDKVQNYGDAAHFPSLLLLLCRTFLDLCHVHLCCCLR